MAISSSCWCRTYNRIYTWSRNCSIRGDVVTARGLSIFIDLLVIVALVGMLLAKKQTKDLEKTDLTENK